jgi:hypothetical protein
MFLSDHSSYAWLCEEDDSDFMPRFWFRFGHGKVFPNVCARVSAWVVAWSLPCSVLIGQAKFKWNAAFAAWRAWHLNWTSLRFQLVTQFQTCSMIICFPSMLFIPCLMHFFYFSPTSKIHIKLKIAPKKYEDFCVMSHFLSIIFWLFFYKLCMAEI